MVGVASIPDIEVSVTEDYPLQTILTQQEADRLAPLLAFKRRRMPSGTTFQPVFMSADDRARAETLIAEWRSER